MEGYNRNFRLQVHVVPDQGYVVPNEGYHQVHVVPDEPYYRNTSFLMKVIQVHVFLITFIRYDVSLQKHVVPSVITFIRYDVFL